VEAFIQTRKSTGYDAAIELLVDLRTVSEREKEPDAFHQRIMRIRHEHATKHSLHMRLVRADLMPDGDDR
jgi:hypothetical protein